LEPLFLSVKLFHCTKKFTLKNKGSLFGINGSKVSMDVKGSSWNQPLFSRVMIVRLRNDRRKVLWGTKGGSSIYAITVETLFRNL